MLIEASYNKVKVEISLKKMDQCDIIVVIFTFDQADRNTKAICKNHSM